MVDWDSSRGGEGQTAWEERGWKRAGAIFARMHLFVNERVGEGTTTYQSEISHVIAGV